MWLVLAITGCAGTGKSFLVRYIVEALKARNKRVAITASTGLAGVQVCATVALPGAVSDEARARDLHTLWTLTSWTRVLFQGSGRGRLGQRRVAYDLAAQRLRSHSSTDRLCVLRAVPVLWHTRLNDSPALAFDLASHSLS